MIDCDADYIFFSLTVAHSRDDDGHLQHDPNGRHLLLCRQERVEGNSPGKHPALQVRQRLSFQRGGRSANWMVLHCIVCLLSNIFWRTTEQIKLTMENPSQTHADSRGAACVGENRRGDQVEGIVERAQEVGR